MGNRNSSSLYPLMNGKEKSSSVIEKQQLEEKKTKVLIDTLEEKSKTKEKEIINTNTENEVLKKMIKNLEKQNQELLLKIEEKREIQKQKENNECKNNLSESSINKAIIRKYIKEMLEDENANIGWMPDFVEKKIYENVFTLLLGLLETNIEKTNIEILGHKIKLSLVSNNKHLQKEDGTTN